MSDRTLPIPKELIPRSNVKAILGCLYAMGLFFGAWWGTAALISAAPWPLWARLALAVPVLVLGGYGMLLMGFMGHDGTHFSLHDDKVVSSAIGIVLTAPIFPYMVMGFTISHWNHHKFTNSDKDPDSVVFAKFGTLFSRALIARPYTFWEYGSNTVRLALGRSLPFSYQFPLPEPTVRSLARFNVSVTLAFGAFYAWVCLQSSVAAAALAVLYVFGTVISGLSPYVEHTGTGLGRGVDTRTASGLWFDVLTLGNNYHLEHHLYPTVPFYNLRRVYLHLKEHGYYTEEKHHTDGFWGTYRYALGKYPYPRHGSKS